MLRDKKKLKPGSDIAPTSYPPVRPEHNVGKYLESKQEDKKTRIFHEWDAARTDPQMQLLFARRDSVLSNKLLSEKRKYYNEQKKKLDVEWNKLIHREEDLRKSFVIFDRFVRENREKKERSYRRINEELNIHARRNQQIESLKTKIAKLKEVKDMLLRSIHSKLIFEDYLTKVVKNNAEYKSITSILNRYDAMAQAKNDLIEKQQLQLKHLNDNGKYLLSYIETKTGEMVGMKNILVGLSERFTKVHSETRYWERIVHNIKTTNLKKVLQVFQIRDSIWNLYIQMCIRKGTPPEIDKQNLQELLEYIKGTLMEFIRIYKIATKRTSKAGGGGGMINKNFSIKSV